MYTTLIVASVIVGLAAFAMLILDWLLFPLIDRTFDPIN